MGLVASKALYPLCYTAELVEIIAAEINYLDCLLQVQSTVFDHRRSSIAVNIAQRVVYGCLSSEPQFISEFCI